MTSPRQRSIKTAARKTATRRAAPKWPRTAEQSAEPHFGPLFEEANDIILLNDREGNIVAANRAAREFGGYTLEELQRGVHIRDVVTPAEFELAMLLTQRALDGLPIPEVYEREAVLRNGQRRTVELRSNVLQQEGLPPLLQTIGRDITERKEAAAFQSSLLQVSEALLSAQRLDQLGRVICEEARRVLGAGGAYLWLRRGETLFGCAAAGLGEQQFVGTSYTLVDDPLLRAVEHERGVLLINEFQRTPYVRFGSRSTEVQSLLAMPLQRGGGMLGLLVCADYENPQSFTSALADRAQIFGAQAAVAIESALAREREEEEGRVSAALLQVARAIRESLEETEVIPQIARSAREVMGCDWTAVALLEAGKECFRVTSTDGRPTTEAEELKSLEFGRGSLAMIDQLLAGVTVEIQEPRGRVGLYERWDIASLLAVPMVRAGRVIGALVTGYRERRGPFSAHEHRVAGGIAAQAAVAVDNARLVEALRRANALKSEFLGMMSHELRTPLSAILGYADLMRDGAMGTVGLEQTQALDRMLLNGRGLLELINMTLDVNRLESGRITLDVSEFKLAEVLHELRSEFGAGAVREGVTLAWPEITQLPALHSDRAKVKLVLRNIIDNALKFTPQGSVTIAVGSDPGRERVSVAVRDSGVGIPADAMGAIFEMFQQLNGAKPNARGGVGLGLYLVRRYTELMGGTVAVDSTVGVGSTFIVEIPSRLARRDGVDAVR